MIARNAFEKILKEYDEKQLRAERDLRMRRERIEQELPAFRDIENRIAEISVAEAIARIGKQAPSDAFREELSSLRREKAEVLARAGYSEADLAAKYECPMCRDTGYIDNQLCSCFQERITDVLYDQSNVKAVLQEENFKTFSFDCYPEGQPRAIARQAVEKAHDFIRNFAVSEQNLLITGATGVGKTFLANCITKELLDSGYFVVCLSAIRLFDILSDAAFGTHRRDPEAVSSELAKRHIYDCDLLVIDDLGTEMVNKFTSAQLFDCLNERMVTKKHTIISTNLSLEQISLNYSERVLSRIMNKYTLIKLLGDDIRMKKRLEEK